MNHTILRFSDMPKGFVEQILEVAEDFEIFKSKYGALPSVLRGKSLGMIFDQASLRTRSAFEIAMSDLGGSSIHYRGDEVRVGEKSDDPEEILDFARVVGTFNQAILSRIYDFQAQEQLASRLPCHFINGMCDLHHPTQALCDLLTIKRKFGTLSGLRVVFVGDVTNVAFSLAEAMGMAGSEFVLSAPTSLRPLVERFQSIPGFTYLEDPKEAVCGAQVIVADSWAPMTRKSELKERASMLAPYRVTEELFEYTDPKSIFMHNLPASRKYEVTSAVIDGPRSVVYEEAVARLHIARALLYLLFSENGGFPSCE